MAYGTTNFTLAVNGRAVGRGPKSSSADGWATRGMLSPAADQWTLDGVLTAGENAGSLELDGGADAPCTEAGSTGTEICSACGGCH